MIIINNIDYYFESDPNIIGTWNYSDFAITKESFNPSCQAFTDPYLTALKFFSDGQMQIKIRNEEFQDTSFSWTRDRILNPTEQTCSIYYIQNIDNEDYLFFEWKSGDFIIKGFEPVYYVFKKVKEEEINQ